MRKIISVLVAVCIFAFALAGCSGPAVTAPEPTPFQPQSDAPDVRETPQPIEQPPQGGNSAPAGTPSVAYTNYIDGKGRAYDRINEKFEGNDELYMSVGMALLPVVMVDLSLIPITLVGWEGSEGALGMLGIENVKIEQNGPVYSITYLDGEGNAVQQTCEYDAATDSMRSAITQDGQEILFFEYVKAGDSYASHYYMPDEGSGGYTLITSFFDESSIAAFGIDTTDKKPDSIFRNASITSDFVVNDDIYFILEDGKLTVLLDGEIKTY